MAERQGRYRRDDRDDDSFSSSLSPSPPPVRRRRSPAREKLERNTRDRVRDDERPTTTTPRLPVDRDSPRMERMRDGPRDRDSRVSRDPRDSRDPRESRDPRDRDRETPPPFSTKRQSLTDRLRSSWNARKDDVRSTPPPPPPNASGNRPPSRMPSRRRSSAGPGPPLKGTTPIAKVREWLDVCNNDHSGHCVGAGPTARPPSRDSVDSAADSALPPRRGSEPPSWRPIWLIDAVDRRLVRARAADRYIALSYVYEHPPQRSPTGRNAPRATTRENVDMVMSNLDNVDMPQAIADGIWLARKLGIRLLWVDRFCIVQDDDVEREEHLRNMGYVFANAYLVVVAAAGNDAETGLSALVRPGGKAPPPVPKSAMGPPGRKGHEAMVRASKWRQRCWTLVESYYARRALFVFQDTMTWECHCDTWNLAGDVDSAVAPGGVASKVPGLQRVLSLRGGSAGTPTGGRHGHRKCTGRVGAAALGFRHPPWPDLEEYSHICAAYATRRLGRVEDTADAFKGFTTILAKSFAGGFVFGMPALFLDATLLWRPSATIRRRQLPPTMASGGMPPVPSWSWMGWFYDGVPPDLTLWRAGADHVLEAAAGSSNGKGGDPGQGQAHSRHRNVNGFRLTTTCQFHMTDRATTAPLRNDAMHFRNIRHGGAGKSGRRGSTGPPLPPGWSKSNSSGGFRHDGDPTALFRYPVPMAGESLLGTDVPINSSEMLYPGTLLSFSTTRAFLDVDFAAPYPAAKDKAAAAAAVAGGSASATASIAAGIPLAIGNIWAPRGGRWIGTLRSHDSWLGNQGGNYEGEEKLEFIAISEGSEREVGPASDIWGPGSDAEAVRAHVEDDGFVDFVNVLWVEWVGGVCYRKGVGHIFTRAWEAFGRERVDVLLG